jgi:hypothetical protein
MVDDDATASRSSMSIDADWGSETDHDRDNGGNGTAAPLRTQVLNLVKESTNYTIRPATLSQKLGISINDASAELCGLLQIVGSGSTFHFEDVGGNNDTQTGGRFKSMVFSFPPDFERRALRAQRREDWKTIMWAWAEVSIKALKVLTAFGLILSTIIVAIAGLAALVAAFIALSRGGGDSRTARSHVTRQMHNLIITLRQLVWCYAMFGPMGDGQEDPFFREAAYDTWLVMSLCCGNPGSIFFWLRASQLRQRRNRLARGWGHTTPGTLHDTTSELEGVTLIRRNRWTGEEETIPVPSSTSETQHRGLLSSVVEFMFGPAELSGPTEGDKWRLRSAFIVERTVNEKSRGRSTSSISLQDLTPFADSPPRSLDDTFKVVSEGLLVVSYFNGIPSIKAQTNNGPNAADTNPSQALFDFPELIAESHVGVRYDDSSIWERTGEVEADNLWENLFYRKDLSVPASTPLSSSGRLRGSSTSIPQYLVERRNVFTALTRNQFFHCLTIGTLNFVGVIWFAQSLQSGGILEQCLGTFGDILKTGLIPVLWFYARLFFAIPISRLLYVVIWNHLCRQRNLRRQGLADLVIVHKDSPKHRNV